MNRFDWQSPSDRNKDRPPIPDGRFQQTDNSRLNSQEIEARLQSKSRIDKLNKLPEKARKHIFEGTSLPFSISGYHHRFDDIDIGQFKVVDRRGEQPNGVYRATVLGPDLRGKTREKMSTFFPDYMTPEEVEGAIYTAFTGRKKLIYENREHEWQGSYRVNYGPYKGDKLIIVGRVDDRTGRTAANSTINDLVSAWPLALPSKRN